MPDEPDEPDIKEEEGDVEEEEDCNDGDRVCLLNSQRASEVRELLEFVAAVAQEEGLKYTLACESLRYVHGSIKRKPYFGAVAIEKSEGQKWKEALTQQNQFTVVEIKNDKSFLHIQYSKDEYSARIYVARIPSAYRINASEIAYPPSQVSFRSIYRKDKLFGAYSTLCTECGQQCESPLQRLYKKRGYLLNARSRQCLAHERVQSKVLHAVTCSFSSVRSRD
jgi:hypothetical protein